MGQLEYLGICSEVAVFGRLCCYGFLVKIQWVSLNAWELICSQVAMFGHLCCMRAVNNVTGHFFSFSRLQVQKVYPTIKSVPSSSNAPLIVTF